jgi:predicted transposase YbfD/YdcC
MHGPARAIVKHFARIADPRRNRGRNHNLLEMVFMALAACMGGADGWADVERFCKARRSWFAKYLRIERGIPSHDTFARLFARLDTAEFLTAMHAWIDSFAGELRGAGVAIDGKTLRGSFDRAAGQSPLHLLTAFATDSRLVLRQVKVPCDSNEIPAVYELLKLIDLEGAVVTLDALHCQKATAKAIQAAGAHYVLTVKRNQENLYAALASRFEAHAGQDYRAEGLHRHSTRQRRHGRDERRTCYVEALPADDPLRRVWPGLQSCGMICRETVSSDGRRDDCEVSYFITDLPPRVRQLSQHLRDHWRIENCEHHVLDVMFHEDASRQRRGASPEISAGFRRMALNLLRLDTTIKDNIRGKRLRAGWDDHALDHIFAAISRQ